MEDMHQYAKIAGIDEKVIALGKTFDGHERRDDERFEHTFSYLKDRFDKIDENFDSLEEKIDDLWDEKNKNEGAVRFGKYIAGAVGGCLVLMAELFIRWKA